MNQKMFCAVTGIFFFLIALLHMLRIFYGWNAVIAGLTIPIWVSWIAVVLSLYLAYQGIALSRKQ